MVLFVNNWHSSVSGCGWKWIAYDLPNCLNYLLPRMYADDTSLTYASADLNSIDNCINYDLNRMYIWLSANKLTLNLIKTEVLLIASR